MVAFGWNIDRLHRKKNWQNFEIRLHWLIFCCSNQCYVLFNYSSFQFYFPFLCLEEFDSFSFKWKFDISLAYRFCFFEYFILNIFCRKWLTRLVLTLIALWERFVEVLRPSVLLTKEFCFFCVHIIFVIFVTTLLSVRPLFQSALLTRTNGVS